MILFAKSESKIIYAIQVQEKLNLIDLEKLKWLLNAKVLSEKSLQGYFKGPRKEMITPWSTNAVEICHTMGIGSILRIEKFDEVDSLEAKRDKMLEIIYDGLDQNLFYQDIQPEPIKLIDDIRLFNEQEGLALSNEEIEYLENLSKRLKRKLTDSEVFGFSQVNSEHCRHKVFNGTFIIDGVEQELSLFDHIKKTTAININKVVSAYRDNVSFTSGPIIEQFAPQFQDKADWFEIKEVEAVLSLKAETHNFPTTVEPFNGAGTGIGGEIRDRLAGGTGSIPLAGTAVYMTAYPRLKDDRKWELGMEERKWLYQMPVQILIKASNGASDFGNKFGQPLICGSILTFEHQENGRFWAYDKVVMLAGGIGYGLKKYCFKKKPSVGDKIVVIGGDNYRIGMGGGAVSSLNTGSLHSAIELNAIQRSNPEMQKRAFNVIRALVESEENPIISIHDHGAGGHLNCISELVDPAGGKVDIDKFPVGDITLSAKELIANESQERIGLIVSDKDLEIIKNIANRERAPLYVVGEITGDRHLTFYSSKTNENVFDLDLDDLFGNPPRTIISDKKISYSFKEPKYDDDKFEDYLYQLLKLESVACKDWLTNKVDRSVTGKVAQQQCVGSLQLPLSNVAAMALQYQDNLPLFG